MAKIIRLTESDLVRLVKKVILEETTGNTSNIKIITNNWSELPSKLESSTLSGVWGGAFYILNQKKDEVPGLEKVITSDMNNKTCFMFILDNIVYLFMYDGMHPKGTVQSATIEKGTSEEYLKYYSKSNSMVKELPEGTTEYILIRPQQEKNLASLIILKNGNPCFTWALPKPGYPPFKDCQ